MRDLLAEIAFDGPKDPNQRVVLMILAVEANGKGQVAMSNPQIGKASGLHERTISRAIDRLIEHEWLARLPQGGWEIRNPFPARAREGSRARSLALTPTEDTSRPVVEPTNTASHVYPTTRAHNRQWESPRGTGTKAGLGIENCPRCGGTGWMQVDPVANGHPEGADTVDVCTCRGGPAPKASSVYPSPKPSRAGLEPQQMMTNLQGVDAARKEMRDEEEAGARPRSLPDSVLAQAPKDDPR